MSCLLMSVSKNEQLFRFMRKKHYVISHTVFPLEFVSESLKDRENFNKL